MPALQSNATTGTGVNLNWIPWGGKGMATRIAFLERSRVLPILLSVICLLAPAAAQHGGGGGHSGGGHFGGGRSSGGRSSGRHSGRGQSGGHFGWLRLGFGKRSARHAGLGTASASDISPRGPLHLWNIPAGTRMPATARIPSTLLSPPLFPRRPDGQVSFVSSPGRRHRGVFFNRYRRFYSSGCFLNGVTQFCYFEPFLPLLSFSGYFDFFDSGFGFGGDSLDSGDELNSQGPPQWEASAIPPTANPSDDDTAEGNSSANPGTALGAVTEGQALGRRSVPAGAEQWHQPRRNRLLGRRRLSRIHQPRWHTQPHSARRSQPATNRDPKCSPWTSVCASLHARTESLAPLCFRNQGMRGPARSRQLNPCALARSVLRKAAHWGASSLDHSKKSSLA